MKWAKIGTFILYGFATVYSVINLQASSLFTFVLSLPLCAWLTVLLHELSHFLFFRLFGFRVKELRVGLFLLQLEGGAKALRIVESGFFNGFCTVKCKEEKGDYKLMFSLLAGGVSGLLSSAAFLALMLWDVVPGKLAGVLLALIGTGFYGFYATLVSPRAADRKLIGKIIKGETGK